jgi:hypothetical protein
MKKLSTVTVQGAGHQSASGKTEVMIRMRMELM